MFGKRADSKFHFEDMLSENVFESKKVCTKDDHPLSYIFFIHPGGLHNRYLTIRKIFLTQNYQKKFLSRENLQKNKIIK